MRNWGQQSCFACYLLHLPHVVLVQICDVIWKTTSLGFETQDFLSAFGYNRNKITVVREVLTGVKPLYLHTLKLFTLWHTQAVPSPLRAGAAPAHQSPGQSTNHHVHRAHVHPIHCLLMADKYIDNIPPVNILHFILLFNKKKTSYPKIQSCVKFYRVLFRGMRTERTEHLSSLLSQMNAREKITITRYLIRNYRMEVLQACEIQLGSTALEWVASYKPRYNFVLARTQTNTNYRYWIRCNS